MSDEPTTLASTGQINLTRAAVMRYMDHRDLQYETARRELLELVMGATYRSEGDSGLEVWRRRSRPHQVDLTIMVSREGPIASVTHISIRTYRPRARR